MFGRLQVTQNATIKALIDKKKKKTDIELLEDLEYENEKKRLLATDTQEVEEQEAVVIQDLTIFQQLQLAWRRVVQHVYQLVYGKYESYFYCFIMGTCFLSGITAGTDTYHIAPNKSAIVNTFVLVVFVVEIVLKIIAAGNQPLNYFLDPIHGRWNTFDLAVTIISVPGVAGRATALVRILRLFRILEQFQKIRAMKAIVMGLLAGMKSIGYILLLLLLVLYIYAVVGVLSFGQNNPFCFQSVGRTLISLFRGITLENWEIMMFIDVFGCDEFDGGLYVKPWEYLPNNVTRTLENKWTGVSKLFHCNSPIRRARVAPVFWVSFIVVASFIVLALFIGVITLNMQDAIHTVRLEKEEMLRKKRLIQQLEDLKNIKVANTVLNLITKVNDSRVEKRRQSLRKAKSKAATLDRSLSFSTIGLIHRFALRMTSPGSSLSSRAGVYADSPDIKSDKLNGHSLSAIAEKATNSVSIPASTVNESPSRLNLHTLQDGSSPNNSHSNFSLARLLAEAARTPSARGNPYLSINSASADSQDLELKEPNSPTFIRRTFSGTGSASDLHIVGSPGANNGNVDTVNDNYDEDEAEIEDAKIKVTSSSKIRRINEMTRLLIEAWHGASSAHQHHAELLNTMSLLARRIRPWKEKADYILDSDYFQSIVTILILFSAILIGLELDNSSPENYFIYQGLENLVVAMFCVELFIRFTSEEFDVVAFFSSSWNIFDCGVIIASGLPGSSRIFMLFRLLRIFRLFKLLRMLPQLQTIVQALISGLASIRYVGVIIGFFFYLYALVGYLLFHENDPEHFGTLDVGLVTLFAIITLDNWGDIMYTNMYGCARYPSPADGGVLECKHSEPMGVIAPIYFLSFIVFGSFVLLTLFIGVVTTAMEAATEEKKQQLKVEEQCESLVTKKVLNAATLDLYKRVFNILDTDGSGTIEVSEIQMGLNCVKMQPTTHELCSWIEAAGLDPTLGSYGMYDFIVFMIAMKKRNARERFKEAIRKTYKRNNRAQTFAVPDPPTVETKPKPHSAASVFKTGGLLTSWLAHKKPAVIVPVNDSSDAVIEMTNMASVDEGFVPMDIDSESSQSLKQENSSPSRLNYFVQNLSDALDTKMDTEDCEPMDVILIAKK